MNTTPDYREATNAAYRILARKRAFSFSTNVFSIVESYSEQCKLITYGQACFLYGYVLEDLVNVSEYGFSIICRHNHRRIIFYNEHMPLACIRFTIAHEIGHGILNHIDEHSQKAEREANCFARNLLCPIPIIYGLGLETANDYVSVFNVSAPMAEVSFEKRNVDRYYINSELFDTISDMLDAYMMGFSSIDEYYRYVAS